MNELKKAGYTDVHCHLTNEDEYAAVGGVEKTIDSCLKAGVETLIVSGFDCDSSRAAKTLSERRKNVFFCCGLQPEEIGAFAEDEESFQSALLMILELARHEKCVAVGEIGLDYHFPDNPPREFQKSAFLRQLSIAHELNLPVVIHSRDACADTLSLLRENRALLQNGLLMHCYSYSAEVVPEFVALGAYFSFGGVVTFKNAEKVKKAALAVPLDRILTETDSPYLAPAPFRGTFPNKPSNVAYVARFLASLRGVGEDTFCGVVKQNAARLFQKASF